MYREKKIKEYLKYIELIGWFFVECGILLLGFNLVVTIELLIFASINKI